MTISIVVRFHFEGIHCWPDAPQHKPEYYLAFMHRHLFYVQAVKQVEHTERDIEIIDFKKRLKTYCGEQFKGPHDQSCESMAVRLLQVFGLQSCRILEDGENGALVEDV